MTTIIKKTPMYENHLAHSAKMVDFSGWSMPVFYNKIIEEHEHVRKHVGLFDVSHMGEIFARGKGAHSFLQRALINDLDLLSTGRGQYTALLNEKGGMIDDLLVYKLSEEEFLLCVNASNTEKDFSWLQKLAERSKDLTLENASEDFAQMAIQGPSSEECLEPFASYKTSKKLNSLEYGEIATLEHEDGQIFYIARTGYTGEKGYEVYMPKSLASIFWKKVLMTEELTKVKPIGLGARDTLRLEACYPLYGQEMDETVSPLEIGIGWATRLDKAISFIGHEAILEQKEKGLERRLYAFNMLDSAIARSHMKVFQNGKEIGFVTSGSVLPSLGERGGLALLNIFLLDEQKPIEIDVRGKLKTAKITKKPMYKAKIKN